MLIQLLTFIVIFVIPVHTVMQLRCHFCHFQKSQIFAAFYVHLTVTQTPPKWVILKFSEFFNGFEINYIMVWNQCVPPENDDFIMHSELNKRADFLQLSHWLYKAEL